LAIVTKETSQPLLRLRGAVVVVRRSTSSERKTTLRLSHFAADVALTRGSSCCAKEDYIVCDLTALDCVVEVSLDVEPGRVLVAISIRMVSRGHRSYARRS